jgi:hypothetical protein
MTPNTPYLRLFWRGEPIEDVRYWAAMHDTPILVVRETVTTPMMDSNGFRVMVNFYAIPAKVFAGIPQLISGTGISREYAEMGVLELGQTLDEWLTERDAA